MYQVSHNSIHQDKHMNLFMKRITQQHACAGQLNIEKYFTIKRVINCVNIKNRWLGYIKLHNQCYIFV